MSPDWLQRIAPLPRPSASHVPEEHAFTGRAWHQEGWLEPRRVIYDHQLVLVQKGCFRIEIDGEAFTCPEGTFLIIPPGRWESIRSLGRGRGRRCWCHFDWEYRGPWDRTPIMTYAPAQPRAGLMRPAPEYVPSGILHGQIPAPRQGFELFERLLQRHLFGTPRERLASRAVLLELLLLLLDDGPAPAAGSRSIHLAESLRLQLKAAVESGAPLDSIQGMFERTHYSYAHLCRLFKAEYGITPVKYIHTLRVDQAKLLLRDTSMTISEIGYRIGLTDPGYFSRLFRAMTGVTPGEYRAGEERDPI